MVKRDKISNCDQRVYYGREMDYIFAEMSEIHREALIDIFKVLPV